MNARSYADIYDQLAGASEELGQDAVDELQLDSLVDHYADQLFPWITVLINEPKYYFLSLAIIESITRYLRKLKAANWTAATREAEIERQLRFLEACVCESLCLTSKGKAVIIGVRLWEKHWEQLEKKVTYESVLNNKGIQKSLGMHATARYYGRSALLFNKEYSTTESVLPFIEANVSSALEPSLWWQLDTRINSTVQTYSQIFDAWLNGRKREALLSAALTPAEKKVLKRALFGLGKERRFHQQFLVGTAPKLLELDTKAMAASEILAELAKDADAQQKKIALEAAKVTNAIGHVRRCYRALLSNQYESEEASASMEALARCTLPRRMVNAGDLAEGGLEFLKNCVAKANLKNFKKGISLAVYEREKLKKPDRNKLYHSNGRVLARPKHLLVDKNALHYREPAFRLSNAKNVLKRLFPARGEK